jgi:hypothetical protein
MKWKIVARNLWKAYLVKWLGECFEVEFLSTSKNWGLEFVQ